MHVAREINFKFCVSYDCLFDCFTLHSFVSRCWVLRSFRLRVQWFSRCKSAFRLRRLFLECISSDVASRHSTRGFAPWWLLERGSTLRCTWLFYRVKSFRWYISRAIHFCGWSCVPGEEESSFHWANDTERKWSSSGWPGWLRQVHSRRSASRLSSPSGTPMWWFRALRKEFGWCWIGWEHLATDRTRSYRKRASDFLVVNQWASLSCDGWLIDGVSEIPFYINSERYSFYFDEFIIYFVHRSLLLQISFTENPLNHLGGKQKHRLSNRIFSAAAAAAALSLS